MTTTHNGRLALMTLFYCVDPGRDGHRPVRSASSDRRGESIASAMGELPLRAVLCDDDATVRHVVRGLAEDCGFEVVGQAALALEALVLAEMTKAHVLVLDLSLKGVSGTDVIPAVRTAAPGTEDHRLHRVRHAGPPG